MFLHLISTLSNDGIIDIAFDLPKFYMTLEGSCQQSQRTEVSVGPECASNEPLSDLPVSRHSFDLYGVSPHVAHPWNTINYQPGQCRGEGL